VYARKKATVATVPDQASTGSGEDTDFGANDWLLEEMYEQYTADPSSVDDSWVSYFKTHGAGIGNGAPGPETHAGGCPFPGRARPGVGPGEPHRETAS